MHQPILELESAAVCAGYYVAEQSNQFSNYTSISTSGIDFEIAEMEIQQKTAKNPYFFPFKV